MAWQALSKDDCIRLDQHPPNITNEDRYCFDGVVVRCKPRRACSRAPFAPHFLMHCSCIPLSTTSVSGTHQKAVRTPRALRFSRCDSKTKRRGSRTRTAQGARCTSRRVRHKTRSRPCDLARIRQCRVCTRQKTAFALCAAYGCGSWRSVRLELTLRAMPCEWGRHVVRAVSAQWRSIAMRASARAISVQCDILRKR